MGSRARGYSSVVLSAVRGVVWGVRRDDCLGLAAEIAYYGLFSLFPFLLFLRSLVPYLPGREQVVVRLAEGLGALISTDSRLYQIVDENVVQQLHTQNNALLSVSVVLTLWGASTGFNILIKALNRAYGLTDTRSWYHRRLLALLLTIAAAVFIPTAVTVVVLGPRFGEFAANLVGVDVVDLAWRLLRWPVVMAFLLLAMALIYRLAPDGSGGRRWRWFSPGGIFSVVAIIATSVGFSWFLTLDVFELKWLTYGAIGAVIVILFWFYMMGLAVLVGGEINAVTDSRREGAVSSVSGAEEPASRPG